MELPKFNICPNNVTCYALMHIDPQIHCTFSRLFSAFRTLSETLCCEEDISKHKRIISWQGYGFYFFT